MQELSIQINVVKSELENVTNIQIEKLKNVIRTVLEIGTDVSINRELSRIYEDSWKEKRFKSFDYKTNLILDYLSDMNCNISDRNIVQELGKIITGFEIEYWNDSKLQDFYEAFSKSFEQLNNYVVQDTIGNDEVKITINIGNEEEKSTQFNKIELSRTGQMMFNKMKATIDNFGESISHEEKLQVVAKLFSDIM